MATYRFTVDFDPATSLVSVSPGGSVSIAPDEISLLTFTLSGPTGVTFPSDPIQWQDGEGQPIDQPLWLVMHRHGDQHLALWDFNSTPVSIDHRFTVSVIHSNQTFSSDDPVIVNEPPSGG